MIPRLPKRLTQLLVTGLPLLATLIVLAAVAPAHASANIGAPPGHATLASHPVAPVANACARFTAGSIVQDPPALFSHNGKLKVNLSYQTTTDTDGRTLFCFMTPEGLENPTLHVHPGDHLVINMTNNTPATPLVEAINPPNCGASDLTGSSVNIHFHGTNISPTCHKDEVVHTLINSGQSFRYDVHFPADEPPGLYWYHPHAHMLVEAALQGGASGAIVVDGIQNLQPAVRHLAQRVLVIRDQNVAGNPNPVGDIPSWDLTLNNVPIAYPDEVPAVIQMQAAEKQLWRVVNASADTIIDLQVQYDGEPQNLQIVGLDGVPTGSQDGDRHGKIVNATDILLPTAGRAEFIVNAPPSTVTNAGLVTLAINTGPDGDNDTQRTLATIQTVTKSTSVSAEDSVLPDVTAPASPQRFENLKTARVTAQRSLYFSEVLSDPSNPSSPTNFYITVAGATPELFDPNNPPAIVTTQGAVEDWTIENQAMENHEFHIHQIHFLVLSQNNFAINGTQPNPSIQGQMLDMIQVPFWDGNPSHPYPSVTVRMDFRGADIGDFVYHCHIAGHEDGGMMAIIRVERSRTAAAIERTRLYLVSLGESLGLLPGPNVEEIQRVQAWCVRRRLVLRRTAGRGRIDNRVIAGRQVFQASAN
jgi:FtsP/CotA-like multicopper oxidase with cupredoxin domain